MKFVTAAALSAVGIAIAATAIAAPAPQGAMPAPTAIVVFDQPNFKGRSLTFDRSVPSLAKVNFNDVIASVQVKGGRDWVLCEHRNFMGKCVRIVVKEKNLKRLKIDGQVSSLYPVPVAPPKAR
ncbi:MAG: beta/gamma crystallin family protein [Alphaproteobacteria bacterium]|nr:beta/gamma crystallin family protein [Alphaproteobacteria bacterium]